jgi:hypothetical protein
MRIQYLLTVRPPSCCSHREASLATMMMCAKIENELLFRFALTSWNFHILWAMNPTSLLSEEKCMPPEEKVYENTKVLEGKCDTNTI